MKFTSLIASIAIAASVSTAQANTADKFADCVVGIMLMENGVTADLAKTHMPDVMQQAKDDLSELAKHYLAFPEDGKPIAAAFMWSKIPQTKSCMFILS